MFVYIKDMGCILLFQTNYFNILSRFRKCLCAFKQEWTVHELYNMKCGVSCQDLLLKPHARQLLVMCSGTALARDQQSYIGKHVFAFHVIWLT